MEQPLALLAAHRLFLGASPFKSHVAFGHLIRPIDCVIEHPAQLGSKPSFMGSTVALNDVWHRYSNADDAWTLRGVNLEVAPGELVGLLGPSGCGKTTLLRLIAGFERPERGSLQLGQQLVAGEGAWLVPERRGVGMVFQDYALFPHLSAWNNARFGLPRGQGEGRVAWLFALLGLEGLEQRYPHQLSGGQRQRLALARALAPSPRVVLLDEPFSSLDVEVRLHLRSELASVLEACNASGVIVTHDPDEALAICNRVAVMREGVLHQCATPQDIVRAPATSFVGSFVLQRNVIPVRMNAHGHCSCVLGDLNTQQLRGGSALQLQDGCSVLVEPKDVEIVADTDGEASVLGREFLGTAWEYRIRSGKLMIRAICPLDMNYSVHTPCTLRLKPGASLNLMAS